MPPKPAHLRRGPGPRPRPKRPATANSAAQPPPTAIPAASKPSQETTPEQTSIAQKTLEIHDAPQKTLDFDSDLVNSGASCIQGNDGDGELGKSIGLGPDCSKMEPFGPEKTIRVEGSGDGSTIAVEDKGFVEAVIGAESGVVGVGAGSGKRKIVKKTVRIVKKVIKRRVPKRVLVDGLENRGSVGKEGGEDSSGVAKSLNLESGSVVDTTSVVSEGKGISNVADGVSENLNVVIEKPDGGEGVSGESSVFDEVVENPNLTDKPIQKMKRVDSSSASEPIAYGTGKDLSCIHSLETESSALNICVSMSEQTVLANDQSGIHNIKSNDPVTEVDRKDVNVCIPDPMEVEKVNDAAENSRETEEIANTLTDNQAKDFLENQDMDIANKVNVELVPDQNVRLLGEKSGNSIQEPKSSSIRLNEGLLLSGEMEALERKKKRKTQIFVGGLDRDTKEDDIKNAFAEAGVVSEVRLVMNDKKPGQNKGFAFVRFATAEDANNALEKYSKVEICGKQIDAAPVEGNDTLYLGNIDRSWKTEDVVTLLQKAGIKNIDKVTLKADPRNIQKNRGFAFVEFETSRDAQIAFNILQKKDLFGKNLMVNVEWAQSLIEPPGEELLKVKSVYAEYLPASWDRNNVKEYFKKFGEIEDVVLAKDLHSSKRTDFAFIKYKSRDEALTCIEAVGRERLADDSSKDKMAVSLANPISKNKQMKRISDISNKQPPRSKQAAQTSTKLHEHRSKRNPARSKIDSRHSTTDELVQLLRQQASKQNVPQHSRMPQAPMMHIPLHPRTGSYAPDHHFPLPGNKRPFSVLSYDPVHMEPQGHSRFRMESSYLVPGPSSSFQGVGVSSFPYHHQQEPGFASEPFNERSYPSQVQTRERAPYLQDRAPYFQESSIYRRY